MSDEMRQKLNALPSMIYHGVHTAEAILMRMNAAPRSVAEKLGARFAREVQPQDRSVVTARDFMRSLDDQEWATVLPPKAPMSGTDCRQVWEILSGEQQ